MRFIVNSSVLNTAIGVVSKVINPKSPMAILGSILFQKDGEGLSLTAGDGENTIICNIPVLIRNPEDFSVHNAFFKANLWFFWSVLFATCLACLMFKLNKLFHIKEWVSVFVLFFGMMLFDDNWLIAQHKFVVPYFLLGGGDL